MSNPYADALGANDPVQIIATTPQRLARVLDGLTPEQIEHHPAPGKWNLREILCHLADCEIVWSWRLRIAYEKDHALLQPFDQDPWAKVYSAYTVEQARATFEALRAWNIAFLGMLTEADKQKPVTHPEHGEWTLWTIVETMAGHDAHHLASLERS